ncbi:unnamed protein product [Dictyota dichotoma]
MLLNESTSNFEFNKFALLLSKYDYKVKPYDILAGVIVGLEAKYALVDLGLGKATFLPLREIYKEIPDFSSELLKINFVAEFFILSFNTTTNEVIISLKEIHSTYSWQRIKQMNFKNINLYAKIGYTLKFGSIIDFEDLKFYSLNLNIPKHFRREKKKYIFIPFKFVEIKDFIHIVEVSSKLALFSKLSQFLNTNCYYTGTIFSVKNFGIFINIFGLQCFLHISKISRQRVLNLKKLYRLGSQIKVKILYKNFDQGKIFITIK